MPTTLTAVLQKRFAAHPHRHPGLAWDTVAARLEQNPAALASLQKMEDTGGEPDVVTLPRHPGAMVFVDCAAESPKGRRSLCYDRAALNARKEHKPASTVLDEAEALGVIVLDEEDYRALQALEAFDLKTSSWILTPAPIRKLGGALFCDRRYDHVFTYHNGADSYYGARGFRGKLVI